ncbi:hypothetical protein TNCV_3510821 [Trichonephila clavipes]|nr:hypothetical protein TNCV_3510821 [Trichonephila clavipes]
MVGGQNTSDRASCTGQLALTVRGERWLKRIVHQMLAQTTTRFNDGAISTGVAEFDQPIQGVIVGRSMEMKSHHRVWGQKPVNYRLQRQVLVTGIVQSCGCLGHSAANTEG